MYWGSVALIALPVAMLLSWLHEQVFGASPWWPVSLVYLGVGAIVAAVARFAMHLVWDVLTLPDGRGPRPPAS